MTRTILRTDEVLDRLGLRTRRSLYKWRTLQGMPFVKRGRENLYVWEDVVEWLKSVGKEGYLMTTTENGSSR